MEESIERCAVFREIERSRPRAVAGVVVVELASNFEVLGGRGYILVLVSPSPKLDFIHWIGV